MLLPTIWPYSIGLLCFSLLGSLRQAAPFMNSIRSTALLSSKLAPSLRGPAPAHRRWSRRDLSLFRAPSLRASAGAAGASSFTEEFSAYRDSFADLTADQLELLAQLSARLMEWNTKVNLISRKSIEFLVPNHIVPSLAVSRAVKLPVGAQVVDVGSGGGFPGLPLAIACPWAEFTLLDSNAKKMMIVQDIADALGLRNVETIASRAEHLTDRRFDFMTGRSVSAVPNFLSFSCHLLRDPRPQPLFDSSSDGDDSSSNSISDGLLYIKGGDFAEELRTAGISSYSLQPVNQLVPALADSDKAVLHIPASEIRAFSERRERDAAAAAAATRRKKFASDRRYGGGSSSSRRSSDNTFRRSGGLGSDSSKKIWSRRSSD